MGRLCSPAVPLVALAVALLFPFAALAQSSTCDTSKLSVLLPCVPYVQNGNTTTPGSDCCTPLSALVGSQPDCLCQLEPFAKTVNVPINETRAYEVATLCKVTVPASVTACLGIAAPAQSPSASSTTGSGSGGSAPPPNSFAASALSPSAFVAVVLTGLICCLFSL